MRPRHILLVGERKDHTIARVLLLEQYGFIVTVLYESARVCEKILQYRQHPRSIDVMVLGAVISDREIWSLFLELRDAHIKLPFIITSPQDRTDLLKRLLEEGFYGSWVPGSDPLRLIQQLRALGTLSQGESDHV